MKIPLQITSLLLCFILAIAPLKNIHAQGFYFNVGGGYGFNTTNITDVDLCEGFDNSPYYEYPYQSPFAYSGFNQTYTEISSAANDLTTLTNTSQSLNKGFGGGTSFFVSAGYSFSKYLSAEIGFSYLAGTTMQSAYTYTNTFYNSPSDTSVTKENITNKLTSSAHCRLLPAIKFSIPMHKFTPYLKAGLVVGLGGKLTLSNSYSQSDYEIDNGQPYPSSIQTANTGLTASGGLSLGYTASAGVEYSLNAFLSVYGEINLVNENWSPSNGDITSYYASGTNPPFVLSSSQFTYSNNVTMSSSNQALANNMVPVSSQYPKQTFSYGSYGVNIGVKFSIPKKAKAATPPDAQVVPK